jgi:hypothetical protein
MRHALVVLGLIAVAQVHAQDSNAFRPIFVATTGIAVPVGALASQTSAAPTAYVGLAFHRGRSRTSFEIGQSFTTFSTSGDQHASVSVTVVTIRRVIPLRPGLETFVALGLGQSWASGSTVDSRLLANASHFGVATLASTGLRLGGRVGGVLAIHYMGLIHSGAVLQVVPVEVGITLR